MSKYRHCEERMVWLYGSIFSSLRGAKRRGNLMKQTPEIASSITS
ncbi:hypothetical protein [Rickettsia bellii]|uniref:Uncharacterized protein n=1 Tax=Rickettsia bellii str. RML An4 TaxID=1359193 RepID=A0A0F3QA52_RICBE|nr:hypothetical protein [Rickettsia bellii]KJV89465.1 hypothetical protein RBEAN4_0443 [Rickettsia bellii str. RML An4]